MAIEARGSVDIVPEGEVCSDYVNPSDASEALRTKGADSNQLRKWCNVS